MDLDTQTWVILGITVALALLIVGAIALVKRRSEGRRQTEALRQRFGDEYDVTIERIGHRHGEAELKERTRRFRGLELDRLAPESREELTEKWKELQYRFLEDPTHSVREAEHLIADLMRERGYPSGGFDTRVGAMSIEHPNLAQPYRDAYAGYRSVEEGTATVTSMFDAMVGYRTVFEALLQRPQREDGVEGSTPPDIEPVFSTGATPNRSAR